MPRGNGTGPMGMGAMSGRGAGYCAGYGMPGYANPAFGQGAGMGRGRGFCGGRNGFNIVRGRRRFRGYGAPNFNLDTETEKRVLKNQADALEVELEAIRKRLSAMETTVS